MHWLWRNIITNTLIALGLFCFIFFTETNTWPSIASYWRDMLAVEILFLIGGLAILKLVRIFNKVFPWNSNRTLRFMIEFCSGIALYILLGIIFIYAYLLQELKPDDGIGFWAQYWEPVAKSGIIAFVLMLVYVLIDFWAYSYNQYSTVQIESVKIEGDQKRLQFEALKSQLSPHFLFNSLNTISSLLYKDLKSAEEYIRKLTSLYQYVLKTENLNLVMLGEEINAIHAYFFLQKIKYGNSIELSVNISPELFNTLIPPLTLQMLVENSLKHNFIGSENILKTKILNEGLSVIVVKNNIIAKPELLKIGNNLYDRPVQEGSHRIGIENIRKRYEFFANKSIEISVDQHYSVKLPVIKKSNHAKTVL
jgi:two-component system, LytTR family, sensor kinase